MTIHLPDKFDGLLDVSRFNFFTTQMTSVNELEQGTRLIGVCREWPRYSSHLVLPAEVRPTPLDGTAISVARVATKVPFHQPVAICGPDAKCSIVSSPDDGFDVANRGQPKLMQQGSRCVHHIDIVWVGFVIAHE